MAAQRSVASCGLHRLVIFGGFFTRGRQRFAALHVATLVYSVIIEIFDFWCPLTTFETWL